MALMDSGQANNTVGDPFTTTGRVIDAAVSYSAPAAAATVTVPAACRTIILEPAGTLATLTVAFPSSPSNGQELIISSTQIVTVLTLSGGTIVGGLSAFAANGFAKYMYVGSQSKWYRIG